MTAQRYTVMVRVRSIGQTHDGWTSMYFVRASSDQEAEQNAKEQAKNKGFEPLSIQSLWASEFPPNA